MTLCNPSEGGSTFSLDNEALKIYFFLDVCFRFAVVANDNLMRMKCDC